MATQLKFLAVDAGTPPFALGSHSNAAGETNATFTKQSSNTGDMAFVATGNRVRNNGPSGVAARYRSASPDALYSHGFVTLPLESAAGLAGIILRASGTNSNGYALIYKASATPHLQLVKMPNAGNGVDTVVQSDISATPYAPTTFPVTRVLYWVIAKAATGDRIMAFWDSLAGTKVIDYTDTSPLGTGKIGLYSVYTGTAGDALGIQLGAVTATDPVLTLSLTTIPVGSTGTSVTATAVGTAWTSVAPNFIIAAAGGPLTPPSVSATVTSDTTAILSVNPGLSVAGDTLTIIETTNENLSGTLTMLSTSTLTPGSLGPISVAWNEVRLASTAPTGGTGSYTEFFHKSGSPFTAVGGSNAPSDATRIVGVTGLTLDDLIITPSLVGYPLFYLQEVRDTAGTIVYGNQVAVSIPPPPTLVIPTLSAGTPGLTSAPISLSGVSGGASPLTYKLYRASTTPGGTRTLLSSTLTAPTQAALLVSPNHSYLTVDVVDSLGQTVTSNEVDVQAASPGAANSVSLLLPHSGPQGYNGAPSSPFTLALSPVGGSVASPVAVALSDGGAGGTFTSGGSVVTAVTLTTLAASADVTYTPLAGTSGLVPITFTPAGGSGLAAPTPLVYTVLSDLQTVVPIVVDYGAAATGQTLGYLVVDINSQTLIAHTTAGVRELAGTGIYSVAIVVPADATGAVIFDPPTGSTTPLILVFQPTTPGPTILGSKDAANIFTGGLAAVAAGMAGTAAAPLQRLLASGIGTGGGVLLDPAARARLASDAFATVDYPAAVTTGTLKDNMATGLAGLFARHFNERGQTVGGVLRYTNDAGQTFLLLEITNSTGSETVIGPPSA